MCVRQIQKNYTNLFLPYRTNDCKMVGFAVGKNSEEVWKQSEYHYNLIQSHRVLKSDIFPKTRENRNIRVDYNNYFYKSF